MGLLDDLRNTARDYWISGTSPDGYSTHPDFQIIHVQKGVNSKEVEQFLEIKEAEMLAVLEGRDTDDAIMAAIERQVEAEPDPVINWDKFEPLK
jgi:hypothetical protein